MLCHTHWRGILQLGLTFYHIGYAACMEYAKQRHFSMTVVPFARNLSGNIPGWPENTLQEKGVSCLMIMPCGTAHLQLS